MHVHTDVFTRHNKGLCLPYSCSLCPELPLPDVAALLGHKLLEGMLWAMCTSAVHTETLDVPCELCFVKSKPPVMWNGQHPSEASSLPDVLSGCCRDSWEILTSLCRSALGCHAAMATKTQARQASCIACCRPCTMSSLQTQAAAYHQHVSMLSTGHPMYQQYSSMSKVHVVYTV